MDIEATSSIIGHTHS